MQPDWFAWLRLLQTPGIGTVSARKLLHACGLPQEIFASDPAKLSQLLPPRSVAALKKEPDAALLALAERTQVWCTQADCHILSLADAAYPKHLLEIPDPPLLLYVQGNLKLLHSPALAIVGSRHASQQGIRNAEQFSLALNQAGLTIISGLALGIDAAAHAAALTGTGATIAVIGTGIDLVYPARNKDLAKQIVHHGCVVSEYPLGTPPIAANFPRRNRIISGLARGVLVVEANAQSGSLITARMAAEQGREVFVIPGSIHTPQAKGYHQLLREGAVLVESAQDILNEFNWQPQRAIPVVAARSTKTTGILAELGFDGEAVEQLSLRLGKGIADVQAELLELELAGLVESLPGGLIRRLV